MIGNRLNFGDTIGVICPATGKEAKIINEKISFLEQLGFKIKKGKNLYNQNSYLAGNDKQRAEDLNHMFYDKKVKAIICFRGGYGSMRCAEYIDWNIIKNNPKIFCGYSDITLLLNYMNRKCNLITFHGPMVISNFSDSLTRESLFNSIMKGFKPFNIPIYNNCELYNFDKSVITGNVVGGNLSIVCSSLHTKYEICTKNKILILEDVDEAPYFLDRMLTQLILSKKIHECKALILGYFSNSNLDFYEEGQKVIRELLIPLNKPIIFNFPFGHQYPNITLPIGANISIHYNKKLLRVNKSVVK